jgi:hypothetical protein
MQVRATRNGNVTTFLKEPVYHGNPIDPKGSLVTIDYGYDIHPEISSWENFDVEIVRFSNRYIGVIGEYTEVIFAQKVQKGLLHPNRQGVYLS